MTLQLELSDTEYRLLSLHIGCRLDDYKKEIIRQERNGRYLGMARDQWSTLARIYARLNPEAISGPWELMDGSMLGE